MRASVESGLRRSALVYSTTARSYSWRRSAAWPRRSAPDDAQPATSAGSTRRAAAVRRRRELAARGAENIDTTRDFEREFLIGQTDVFLQIRERKGRSAPLAVDGDQAPNRQGRRVDDQHEPIVVPLAGFRHEFQRPAPGGHAGRQLDQ